ncbi:MAG: hypothetical protein NTU94_11180, partial [Planctomycetota bacterium]|nr:hypothetical protein [Planctomycetota bacterium]
VFDMRPVGLRLRPDDATLGAPPVIRLMTTGGGHTGADIIIIGLTNDDVPNTTGLYLDAGAAGNIRLGAVGGLATVASVAIANAQTVDLGAVTAGGSQGINLNANGPINLTGGLTTFGSPIIIQGIVVVGGPTLTLDTTCASSIGACISITVTVNGIQAKTTILVLRDDRRGGQCAGLDAERERRGVDRRRQRYAQCRHRDPERSDQHRRRKPERQRLDREREHQRQHPERR